MTATAKCKDVSEKFEHEKWTFLTEKSHILTKEQEDGLSEALKLPHLPDMLFVKNRIRITHEDGFGFELNPMDALKHVNNTKELIHVAASKEWLEARKDSPHIKNVVHPYDWTFTPTDYRGSIFGDRITIKPTEEKIDYKKLQEREKILFFDEVILYEDELDDNGCSMLSAKLRVMPSGFFCLLRFYLRVDKTILRVYDTRLHHVLGTNKILREYSEREEKMENVTLPPVIWRDQNEIGRHLTVTREVMESLEF